MKFSCIKPDLEHLVGIAERFCGRNSTMPILGHILLEAQDSTLTVTATNLEHAVQLWLPARVPKPGRVSVPAKILSFFLQSLGDDKIEAEAERGNLHLHTPSRDGRVNGSNPEEFPLIPKIKKTDSFKVGTGALSRALGRILPAVSVSEFKPELGGVFFRAGKDNLTLCATDTFRLAECTLPLARERLGQQPVSFILPQRPAQELTRILEQGPEDASFSVGENQILIEIGSGSVVSRLIEGNFPEYRTIIPAEFSTSSYLEREDLVRGVRASSIFASKMQEVKIGLGSGQVEISSSNPEVGEYHTKCPASLNGREITMNFNWRYLLDGLQSMEDEQIFFGCNQESSPALFRNKSHTNFAYVVMPIRVT